jgi:hypothetical protein
MAAFGSAGALALVGLLCGILIDGLAGQVLAIALISIGLGGALLLVFYEVGLSEDQARARAERGSRGRRRPPPPPHARSNWRRRP